MNSTNSGLIPDTSMWQTAGMIVPAVMTLICFICTAVSLTVSGFICLRDREAQDESDLKAKHQQEQEFVSKVLGLFYKTRTSNVFRIKEIVSDLNDERPVWIGEKNEIVSILEYYGIFLTEKDKAQLPHNAQVFEIDCESLFYFELERFSKAQAIYGSNVLKYFQAIQQDGAAFPREFYPDIKSVFSVDIIYNVFTEMQIITELFVLLATGIDLEIISVHAIPPQFRHSQLGNEFAKIKDFLYNYYLRVFPKERSTASVMRILPKLPLIYQPVYEERTETVEKIVEEEEEFIEEDEVYELPKETKPVAAPSPPEPPASSTPPASNSPLKGAPPPSTSRGRRLSSQIGKRLKMAKVYKTLAERIRQRPYYQEEEEVEEEEEEPEPEPQPSTSRQVRFESPSPVTPPKVETIKRTVKRKVQKRVPVTVKKEVRLTQEEVFESMRYKYKAPIKRDGQARRRGWLFHEKTVEHNAFTYMVARVLAFLQEKGHISDAELNTEKYLAVDRNFIV